MHIARIALVALPALLALAGCEDPTQDRPKATVSSAVPASPQATAPAAATLETLSLDPAASSVQFVGSKITRKHEGKFEKVSGTVSLAGGKLEGGKMSVDIETASVKTDDEKLDGHLKSPDFFDVAKFPKATFTSKEIKTGGDKNATHTITGELDLHGVKKVISFPTTVTVGADAISGTAEFVINRKDFSIVYPGMPDDLIREDVLLKLTLKAPKKS